MKRQSQSFSPNLMRLYEQNSKNDLDDDAEGHLNDKDEVITVENGDAILDLFTAFPPGFGSRSAWRRYLSLVLAGEVVLNKGQLNYYRPKQYWHTKHSETPNKAFTRVNLGECLDIRESSSSKRGESQFVIHPNRSNKKDIVRTEEEPLSVPFPISQHFNLRQSGDVITITGDFSHSFHSEQSLRFPFKVENFSAKVAAVEVELLAKEGVWRIVGTMLYSDGTRLTGEPTERTYWSWQLLCSALLLRFEYFVPSPLISSEEGPADHLEQQKECLLLFLRDIFEYKEIATSAVTMTFLGIEHTPGVTWEEKVAEWTSTPEWPALGQTTGLEVIDFQTRVEKAINYSNETSVADVMSSIDATPKPPLFKHSARRLQEQIGEAARAVVKTLKLVTTSEAISKTRAESIALLRTIVPCTYPTDENGGNEIGWQVRHHLRVALKLKHVVPNFLGRSLTV